MYFAASAILGLSVFSQAMNTDIGSIIGNVGVLGALFWFMYYVTSVAQPRMLDKFTDEQKELRKAFADELSAIRLAHTTEQAAMRTAFAQEQAAMRAAFAQEQAKMREHYGSEAKQMRDLLATAITTVSESARNMRVAVHDVKDAANAAIMESSKAIVAVQKADGSKAGDSKHGP